ncbi:helix-turn-helix transcriptional regulator [Streptomyces griseoflavus]
MTEFSSPWANRPAASILNSSPPCRWQSCRSCLPSSANQGESGVRRRLVSRLRQLREAAGLSLAGVAAQIEVNQGSLSRIENGERGTTPVLIRALLDCTLPDFGVALQAEALLTQQPAHRVRADPVSPPSQFGRLVGVCAWYVCVGGGGRSRTLWPGRYSQDRLALDQTPAATADPAD